MRRLNRKKAFKVVKELDAFPKVPDSYQVKSNSGATVSLLTFALIAVLVISEFNYYLGVTYKYDYDVDRNIESDLVFNIDVVVAMKCVYLGADLLDLSGTTHTSSEEQGFKSEETFFEMTAAQREWLRNRKELLARHEEWRSLKDEQIDNYRLIHTAMPQRSSVDVPSNRQPDACRIFGKMFIKKIAGNFHITAGKAIAHPRGHAHMSAMVPRQEYNFSHRIDHLSFGNAAVGTLNPLDGEMKVAVDRNQMYQYFLQIVPTSFSFAGGQAYAANQYSVTRRERIIDHSGGSHGVPGIFMKYDMSALTVSITQDHQPFGSFVVRICGIIGGIFATTGMLHGFIGFLFDVIFCRKKGVAGSMSPRPARASQSYVETESSSLTTDMRIGGGNSVGLSTTEH
ncbi:endoplasmic reticulum-Golgi intermediate compartment protein 2-like [Corticium candelabrum]|uniref:endoplasmic reticulum-Golgi intermediate compartment protein 2-like n=1 Tax=Corticium candelabrum TaxID=121492 RepID=UPI002E274E1B|nr:endoplasmic reticulum-Golgi intermediate compartment protein 2-like [Corticium candelabrum]